MENRFNLIDEPWIPVTDQGKVSLRQIFTEPEYRSLGGNPVQKIALLKLLLAIAQAAATPKDEQEWQALGAQGLAKRCLAYLDKWYDHFYLYGDKPFLQMPAIATARALSYGAFVPEVSTGNTTVLNHSQVERELSEADKALLLLTQMGFALSGKKTDNSVVLSEDYAGKKNNKGKPSSGKAGPSVGHMGFLHTFLLGVNLQTSLWLNLFSKQKLTQMKLYPEGMGQAPWEEMPVGEGCARAKQLKQSLMGRLIPLCRFCLLTPEGMHYSEGIAHAGYKEGMLDTSMAVNYSLKDPKALWADPEKRPWRELTSLLSFFEQSGSQGFHCWQVHNGLDRIREAVDYFTIWSGGLRVSSNAGEQYVSGNNDSVESQVGLESAVLGEGFYVQLKQEMEALESLAKNLYGRVIGYFKDQKLDGAKLAAQATQLFWQLCERDFQTLVDNCEPLEETNKVRQQLRRKFSNYQQQAYDFYCPKGTARQLDYWVQHRPNNFKYLAQEA
ncbi:type I-E CRISPR-associated protein Cse1/CasA [Marinospirillum insulare]|uniref:Type I-E CRISPR-associated protein Cse1/CasA n=1 Tax=Marinospirillum insulare TaxID=217169 RepID=A0ABQ5ZR35_9GAMM|nr:type I-E CRISPR-associated protein Cse1/CasA [Marinospirillum insulare]GLR62601.1 type I-E CRISPR-associated protein Cse1/CasA [Marinospirillum insulare]